LDEPFGSLDAKVRKNLAQWIRDLHKRIDVTGIFVTHDQNEAMEIADKIILINRGKVEQIGSPQEIYESPNSKFVASFVGNVNVIDSFIEQNHIFINGAAGSIPYQPAEENNEIGEVVLLVRPEEVSLSRENCGKESIPVIIRDIYYRGSFYEIHLDIGANRIKSILNKDAFLQFRWQEGERAYACLKHYKIFDASGGFHQVHAMLKQYGYIE
jgi:sulfate transport system ATP-binding protein